MAQHASEAIGSGLGRARGIFGPGTLRAAALGLLLLGAGRVAAGEPSGPPPRSVAELIPAASRFFLEVNLGALRDRGPTDAVHRIVATLAPLASESGLSAERLRTIVMASAEDPLDGEKLPSWLLFAQDGAAPALGKLEATFRRYSHAPLKSATVSGISYHGNRDLSVLQLPGGPALVSGATGPRLIVEAWQGKGGTPLVRSPTTELMQRVSGERPTAFRVWLTLTAAMQRSLVEDARLPAVPTEVAVALRLLPDRGAELGLLGRCSDEETAKRLAAWLSARLVALGSSGEVQLLGLANYVQASKVTSDGALVSLQLPMSATEVAALLERAVGLLGTLAPHAPSGSSGPATTEPSKRPAAAPVHDKRLTPK